MNDDRFKIHIRANEMSLRILPDTIKMIDYNEANT